MIVAATKIDVMQDRERLTRLEAFCREQGLPLFAISGVTGEGVEQLKFAIAARLLAVKESPVSAS
jgi:50S ribosomal subunit-associated GTPase HflX